MITKRKSVWNIVSLDCCITSKMTLGNVNISVNLKMVLNTTFDHTQRWTLLITGTICIEKEKIVFQALWIRFVIEECINLGDLQMALYKTSFALY